MLPSEPLLLALGILCPPAQLHCRLSDLYQTVVSQVPPNKAYQSLGVTGSIHLMHDSNQFGLSIGRLQKKWANAKIHTVEMTYPELVLHWISIQTMHIDGIAFLQVESQDLDTITWSIIISRQLRITTVNDDRLFTGMCKGD